MLSLEPTYPNLELIEYKTRLYLKNSTECQTRLNERKKRGKSCQLSFDAMVFSQMWGSTCTGFDKTKGGMPVISGSAMTKAYTTVMHETITNTWFVFFGNDFCYMVFNPQNQFFEDLSKHQMASFSEAERIY